MQQIKLFSFFSIAKKNHNDLHIREKIADRDAQ